jgi:ubiquinol-cytochrome c reductase cytochrome b/c1 subunit
MSRRFIKNFRLLNTLYKESISYLSPLNLSGWWNFGGSLALFCLVIQIITGVLLAMHFIPTELFAFNSVEHVMREIKYGWFLRYLHANGASFFFLVVYVHVFRGLYYGSYIAPRRAVWNIGVIILLIMILTAFLGYVLPWGQMSFWAATVITSLLSTVPVIGTELVHWLWGGFSVTTFTLNRFFSLHYLLPFILILLVFLHLALLHEAGSGNPLGIESKTVDGRHIDGQRFHPHYTIKDLHGILLYLLGYLFFVFFAPNYFGHPDNYIPANPDQTPAHIVPEWYFLPFYAILRSVPNKLLGVILLVLAIVVLIIFPFLVNDSALRATSFRPIFKFLFWIFLVNCFILGWIGGKPIEYPYYTIGVISTLFYFLYFTVFIPFMHHLDKLLFRSLLAVLAKVNSKKF